MKQQRKTKLVFGKFLTILGVIVGYTLIFSWGMDFILCDLLHLNERVDGIVISFLVYAAMSTLLIFVLEKIGKMHILKFEKERFFRGLLMGLPMILLGIFLFYRNFSGAINEGLEILPVFEIVLFSAVILLGVGFTEEVLYRGIVENLLFGIFGRKTKKAVYLSVLISGFLFGVLASWKYLC